MTFETRFICALVRTILIYVSCNLWPSLIFSFKGLVEAMAWNKVQGVAMKQLKGRLDEVEGVIGQHALFKDFMCQIKKYGPQTLAAMIRDLPDVVDWSFQSVAGVKGSHGANPGQKHLAAVAGKLLEILEIEILPSVKKLADQLQLDGSGAASSSSDPPIQNWASVNNDALKELGRRLDEIDGIIDVDSDLKNFKYEMKDYPFDLKTLLRQYPVRVDTVFYSFRPERKTKPYPNQVKLAVVVCKLLEAMGIAVPEDVSAGIAPEAPAAPAAPLVSETLDLDPRLTEKMEDGRVIYIIFVDKSIYFKLGTYKLRKMQFNPDGPCILDRFSNRPTPPSGMPPDTIWKMEKLSLCMRVYSRDDLGEAPDDAINKALRKLAGELSIPLAPQGEFHHMGMLCEAVKMVTAASVNAVSDGDVDLAAPEAVPEAAAPVVVTDASVADFNQYNKTAELMRWPQIHVSPGAHARYNVWANAIGRPLLPALPATRRSGAIQQKRKAKGLPTVKQQKRKAKGPAAIKQQKRKAKDDTEGSLRKYLTKKE
jgi:hypothetical protein